MENLNKENFFNQMVEQYPDAMADFGAWIDRYKDEVNWNIIFNEYYDDYGSKNEAIKFHELPFNLQLGLIIQYGNEVHGRKPHNPEMMMQHMTTILSSKQSRINHLKEKELNCENNDGI